MVKKGPGTISDDVRNALKAGACQLALKKTEQMYISAEACVADCAAALPLTCASALRPIHVRKAVAPSVCSATDRSVMCFLLSLGVL
jgi:hypothetical protein